MPIQIAKVTMKPFNNLENKTPLEIYWKVQLVCMKIQAHSYLNHNQNTIMTRHFWQIKTCYDLLNHLRSYRSSSQFQISSRRENRWRDNWLFKIRVLRKAFQQTIFLCQMTTHSPLLRTLLAIHRKSREPSLGEMMDLFY